MQLISIQNILPKSKILWYNINIMFMEEVKEVA